MRTVLVVVALAVCAASMSGQDAKKYEKDGKFTVKFPNPPDHKTKSAAGLTLNVFLADYGKGTFLVTYSDIPPEVLKAPKPEQVLESSEKALVENFKAKINKSGATMFGPKKYPAREIVAERDEIHIRGTIVLAGSRLYQVYVFGPKEFIESKESSDFLGSFAITD